MIHSKYHFSFHCWELYGLFPHEAVWHIIAFQITANWYADMWLHTGKIYEGLKQLTLLWDARSSTEMCIVKHVVFILLKHKALKLCPWYSFSNLLQNWTRTTRTPAFWDTPRRPMITHTSDSHQIQSENKTSKLHILNNCQKFQILQETWHATHLLKLLDKMCKYEMDSIRIVGTTERTCDAGRTRDRWTDGVKPIYPPTTSLCGGYNNVCLVP